MTLNFINKYLLRKISTPVLLNRAVSTVFTLGTFIGLLPLKYDVETNTIIKRSKLVLRWSEIISIFQSFTKFGLLLWSVSKILLNLKDFAVSELISWLLAVLFAGVCSFPYYQVHVKRNVVKKILENVLKMNGKLLPLKDDGDLDRKLLWVFWCELITDITFSLLFFIGLIYDTIIRKFTIQAILENVTGAIGTVVYAFVVHTFHGGMITVAHYTQIINENLKLHGKRVDEIKKTKNSFQKVSALTKRFAELGWEIKKLMQYQEITHKIQRKLIEIYRSVLLVMLGNIFIALVMQFQNFYLQMDTTINHGIQSMSDTDTNRLAFTIFIASFVLIQHYFIVHGPQLILDRTDETKRLLVDMQSICIDTEIRHSIELFTVQLINQQHTIYICDLFDCNYNLCYHMFQTVASYIIVLVQFQLGSPQAPMRAVSSYQ